jgi:hypothetical protein
MRYATEQEIANGVASQPCYLDGKGNFLKQVAPVVTLAFDVRKPGDRALKIPDTGYHTKDYKAKQESADSD